MRSFSAFKTAPKNGYLSHRLRVALEVAQRVGERNARRGVARRELKALCTKRWLLFLSAALPTYACPEPVLVK